MTETLTPGAQIGRRPMAWVPVGLIALSATLLLLITAGRYGYHRDELYFRVLGDHPAWGYVDQPPFTPLLDRLAIEVLGDSLWAIRVPGALMVGLAALLAAALAREVGGGAGAQSLAATVVFGTFPLSAAHVGSTAAPDLLVWLGVLLFVVRALLHDQPRAWLWAGLVTGFGLYNKLLVILLLLCLAGGLLVAGPRRVLRSPWLWGGVAIALVVGLPNLIYQVAADFPQAKMAEAIAEDKGTDSRVLLVPFQLLLISLPPVWIAGLVALLRDPRWRPIRALAVAYPVMLVLVLVISGQPYYPLGLLTALFAIGAVPTVRWLDGRRSRLCWLIAGSVFFAGLAVVTSLPVIPEGSLADTTVPATNQTVADQIGWPDYVAQVAAVYRALPADEQSRAVLFTGNYGEAGALNRFGRPLGLPEVYSGQNELHNFGPPPDDRTVVIAVLQTGPARAAAMFGSCTEHGALRNAAGVENEETEGAHIYVCHPATPWHTLWPALQHYS
ncbi:glycosyltransferase family 39 protein [Actinoplanes oblitus]|uniref:Glycosyltransferase family 39 protein n=1 Tax=Actinoplanes oblitus TaxID=3040509 RepID=A0ABY8WF83_9ACTN|nr:glycosyltransferase family 39 protein [Actinoplanes oblitus]WIM95158.1 glycosyltransferase family 39 protein [Actinoplanes oblitus]